MGTWRASVHCLLADSRRALLARTRLAARADARHPEVHGAPHPGPRVDGQSALTPAAVDARRQELVALGVTDLAFDLGRLDEATGLRVERTVAGSRPSAAMCPHHVED